MGSLKIRARELQRRNRKKELEERTEKQRKREAVFLMRKSIYENKLIVSCSRSSPVSQSLILRTHFD